VHSTARCCLHVQHQLGYQRQCQSYRNARLGWASEALALCLPFEHFPDFSSIHGLDIQCAALTGTRLNVRVRILGRVFRAARLTPFSWHSWRQRNQDDSGRRRTRVGGISENMVFRFERPSVHACPCLKCSLPGSRMLRVLNGPAWRPPVGTAICADGFARRTTRRRALATCSQAHAGRSSTTRHSTAAWYLSGLVRSQMFLSPLFGLQRDLHRASRHRMDRSQQSVRHC
jgi:hypothetical protein